MSRLLKYFDLRDEPEEIFFPGGKVRLLSTDSQAPDPSPELPPKPKAGLFTHVLVLYAVLVFGIFSQPFLINYQQTGTFSVEKAMSVELVIFSFLLGMALFPLAYKRAIKAKTPSFVTFCSVFTLGLGWQTLFGTIIKVAH